MPVGSLGKYKLQKLKHKLQTRRNNKLNQTKKQETSQSTVTTKRIWVTIINKYNKYHRQSFPTV